MFFSDCFPYVVLINIYVLYFQVNLNANREQFNTLLTELFSDGNFSKARIVFLFFFCSDVVKRALELRELFWNFIDWSMWFMAENLGRLVAKHGGWVSGIIFNVLS